MNGATGDVSSYNGVGLNYETTEIIKKGIRNFFREYGDQKVDVDQVYAALMNPDGGVCASMNISPDDVLTVMKGMADARSFYTPRVPGL